MSWSCSNSVRGVIAGLGCIVYSGKNLETADQMTAVDDQRRAAHVARGIRGKQQQRPFEIFEIAGAPLRDAFDHRDARVTLQKIAIDVGREIAGRDAVDANVVA